MSDETLASFEQCWRRGVAPSLQDYCKADLPVDARVELVLLDLEYRWRAGKTQDALGRYPRLEDYARVLPFPAEFSWPARAIAEEYRVRRLWGDAPTHDHFLTRFPALGLELIESLRTIDNELAADDAAESPGRRRTARHLVDPRAPLPDSDFLLHKHVGTGGVGKVFRARQLSLERDVAVKTLLKSRQSNSDVVERFLREARLLAQLRHDNIVGVHGLGRFPGGGYFIVMDWIDGGDLSQHVTGVSVSIGEAVRYVRDIGRAVEHAHSMGIVHCDIKPANVLVDRERRVYLTDFGMALLQDDAAVSVGGTLPYMAPEQRHATSEIGPAADIYGLGSLLLALASGEHPTSGRPFDPGVCRELLAADHASLSHAIEPCLAPDPAGRYPTVSDFLAELSRLP